MSVAVSVAYESSSSHSLDWGDFCTTLQEAQQGYQAVASGALRWSASGTVTWEAVDPETWTVFEIDQRPY